MEQSMHQPLCIAIGLVLALTAPAFAQRPDPSRAFVNNYPTSETAERLRDETDLQRAAVAYRFWYPTVSMQGIFEGNRSSGIADGKAWAITAASPRQIGFTLNSDTPYGAGILDLSNGPIVIELPPGPFIGLVNDHHQGWVLDMGLTGPDAGKGGKHLILPPDYTGEIPNGYHVGLSRSLQNLIAVRSLPVGGDLNKALDALRAVKIYPLSTAANPQLLQAVDILQNKVDSSSLRWEDNLQFWQVLDKVIQAEPPVPSFLPMYGLLAALGLEKGKVFNPDSRMKAILERAARTGRDQLLVSAFASTRPDRINWPDRKWEWLGLVPGNAQFETQGGIDLEARNRWFAQAIVTSPAMFRRTPGAGSLYWMSARDKSGAFLDGGKTYRLTIPQPVPEKLFWSVTVYDAATRSQVRTEQDKAALRSLFELRDAQGSKPLDLYFGPEAPRGHENRWIKTSPNKGWFAYLRLYGPEQAAFDRSWKPGDFEEIEP
jgi:hypothetical protein